MIKPLTRIIGQSDAKATLNEIITAKNFADNKKKPFLLPPLLLSGPTGVGKTHLAEKYAEAFSDADYQFISLPVKAGWRFFDQLAQKACIVDEESGSATALPTIFFVDEAHEPSPIEEMVKLITGTKTSRLFERNGTRFFHDPTCHQWLFASNEELDPAQKRRCMEVPFGPYDRGEKKQLITIMCEKKIDEETLEFLESRTKPAAGDIEQLCRRLNLQPVDKIGLKEAKTVIQHMGLFPKGLVRKDLELLLRMSRDVRPTPIDALKAKIGDVKTNATRARLGWLQALELTEIRKGGYGLTTQGLDYLKQLKELQSQSGDKKDKKPVVAKLKK